MITIVSLVTWDDKLLTRTFKTCFCDSLEGCKAVWLNVISILGVTFLCPACFRTGSFIPPWGRIIFYCVAGPRFCLSARQLMDTWVVLTLWLLWTVLWTWVCKYLFVSLNLNSLGVELLGRMVNSIFFFLLKEKNFLTELCSMWDLNL